MDVIFFQYSSKFEVNLFCIVYTIHPFQCKCGNKQDILFAIDSILFNNNQQ